MRMVVSILAALALTLGPFAPTKAALTVSAPSAILIDAATGTVLFEQNADEQREPGV